MKKILSTIVASIALVFSGLAAAPALAADFTYVDTFVVSDPSLGTDCMGNGITFVGDVDVAWQIDGQPYSFTPQGRTLWLPRGFSGTITATSTDPTRDLVEIDANRQGRSLSWQHTVTRIDCTPPVQCDTTQAVALAVELAVTKAKVARQRATIQRLRAKLQR